MDNVSFARTSHNLSKPPFVVDDHSIMRDTGRQIDWSLLDERFQHGSQTVEVDTGGAAIGATTIPVLALSKAIPKFTVLRFSVDEFARLTADAAAGATSIAVEALVTAVEAGDKAYTGGSGGKAVPAGEEMDLLASGKIVPSSLGTAGVTCYGLLMTRADEDSRSDSITGYGVITQGQIYENLLPNATGSPKEISSTHKTELAARGGAWMWFQYADNTA